MYDDLTPVPKESRKRQKWKYERATPVRTLKRTHEKVRELLKLHTLSQADLAIRMGIPGSQLSQTLSRKIGFNFLNRILDVSGFTPAQVQDLCAVWAQEYDKDSRSSVALKVREHLYRKSLTLTALADLNGLSGHYLSKQLRSRVGLDLLERLMTALDLGPEERRELYVLSAREHGFKV